MCTSGADPARQYGAMGIRWRPRAAHAAQPCTRRDQAAGMWPRVEQREFWPGMRSLTAPDAVWLDTPRLYRIV